MAQTWDVPQITTEGGNTVGLQAAACQTAQALVDGGGRLPLSFFFIGHYLVVLVEVLQGRGHQFELTVVIHDGLGLFGREPPLLLVTHDERIGLTVEGFVVGLVGGVDGSRRLR